MAAGYKIKKQKISGILSKQEFINIEETRVA
jgi:hypothetical protein